MKNFNPRHLRKKYRSSNGANDAAKSKAFRRCKQRSDIFIHRSASALASPALAAAYSEFCDMTRSGLGFRKG